MADSILEKVISQAHAERASDFSPEKTLDALFATLTDRERGVLVRRFGLSGDKPETLERIGRSLEVTRERVRQIERGATTKVRTQSHFDAIIGPAEQAFSGHIEQAGGATTIADLLERVRGTLDHKPQTPAALSFLLHSMLQDRFARVENDEALDDICAHHSYSLERARKPIALIEQLLGETSEPQTHAMLHEALVARHGDAAPDAAALETLLRIARNIHKNPFDEHGLNDWPTIRPKRMTDKIYLVLKHYGKPLHFSEIAEKVNEVKFDHKTAHAPTVHNELIMDDRYILVGRGMYALKIWGFKPGMVADVIASILADAVAPLTRDEIVDLVLKERMVGKATVHLALGNVTRFVKYPDGRYTLRVQEA